MIEPREHFFYSLDKTDWRQWRPSQDDDAESKCARRTDLAVAGGAAAVLGDDRVDGMGREQSALVDFSKRPSRRDIVGLWQGQRRPNRIDASDKIMMLRRCLKGQQILAAERKEDAPRRSAKCAYRFGHGRDVEPTISGLWQPRRAPQCEEPHTGRLRGLRGIRGNDCGIGMRRVDQDIDALGFEIIGKAGCTAETAGANWDRLRRRTRCAPGERQGDGGSRAARQPFAKLSCFQRAAENEDTHVAC